MVKCSNIQERVCKIVYDDILLKQYVAFIKVFALKIIFHVFPIWLFACALISSKRLNREMAAGNYRVTRFYK